MYNTKDGFTVTPAQDINLPFLTLETALQSITDRTGTDALSVEQEAYFADHMNIKKYKPYKLMGADNISLTIRGEGYERKGMIQMLKTSTDLQQMMVGATHELAYTSEIGVHIYHCCEEYINANAVTLGAEFIPAWMKDINMLLSGYELYENPLGGLNWDVYDVLKSLTGTMYQRPDEFVSSPEIVEHWLRKGGLNASKTGSFMDIADFVGIQRKAAKDKVVAGKVGEVKADAIQAALALQSSANIPYFIGVAAELSFLLSRGKFVPGFKDDGARNGHLKLAVQYLEWCPEVRAEMAKSCVGISMLEAYMSKVLPVVCPGAKKLAPSVEQEPRINISVLLG